MKIPKLWCQLSACWFRVPSRVMAEISDRQKHLMALLHLHQDHTAEAHVAGLPPLGVLQMIHAMAHARRSGNMDAVALITLVIQREGGLDHAMIGGLLEEIVVDPARSLGAITAMARMLGTFVRLSSETTDQTVEQWWQDVAIRYTTEPGA